MGYQGGIVADHVEVPIPGLAADLDGFTILHISDIHARSFRRRFRGLIQAIQDIGCVDLLAVTGDLMDREGDEKPAAEILRQVLEAGQSRLGAFGVFGNHDTLDIRPLVQDLPIRWLVDDACSVTHRQSTVSLLGLNCNDHNLYGDIVKAIRAESPACRGKLRILLSHMPMYIPVAADLGIHLVLTGHTHGGQCRLPGKVILYSGSGGWPVSLSSGILRKRDTLGIISRGIGESAITGLRFLCPPHILHLTLRPAEAGSSSHPALTCIRKW